jgi:hypothetical protein
MNERTDPLISLQKPERSASFARMPHRFRTPDGTVWQTGRPFPLFLPDGREIEGIWGGCAQNEKLAWWLKKPGHELAQSAVIAGIGIKGEDDDVLRWDTTPQGARLFFVVEPPKLGKSGQSYRLVKMVTVAATPEQFAFFRDERYALLGEFDESGGITVMAPSRPPDPLPSQGPAQGELF